MESHKKIVSILFIVMGCLQILGFAIASAFFSIFVEFLAGNLNHDEEFVLRIVTTLIPIIFWCIIFLMSIPSIIGGIALLNGRKWGLTLLLILGCFKLFSFPVGTALGVYTIWIYAEDNKRTAEAVN